MNQRNLDFLDRMFPFDLPSQVSLLIVHQSYQKVLKSPSPQIEILNSKDKGLAKSRNLGLYAATAEICMFADDDVVFFPGFETHLLSAFTQFPNSALIRFQYENEKGVLAKSYPQKAMANMPWLEMMNTSSIEMAVNRTKILEENLMFDENFGLGSGVFEMGEEQVFLASMKQDGLQTAFYPQVICRHPQESSTSKLDFKQRYFITGGMAEAIFKGRAIFWIFLKIVFDVKQNKLNLSQLKQALKNAKNGRKQYQNLTHD